jgi:hypothetical protein
MLVYLNKKEGVSAGMQRAFPFDFSTSVHPIDFTRGVV